ncbi:tyrosine-type recombinase/integrase [Halalkalicoccus tibetensis]|uniref:Tyrosine-type recombinase/integrase n=1 Tax=Halalkalicoccus tibetensis TaxID=175632 RepID=A0ABD5UYJ1_9EURY
MASSESTQRNDLPNSIPVLTQPAKRYLNDRQQQDYETHRRNLLSWLHTLGKNPEANQGYSDSTLEKTAYRLDQFYRWVWQEEGYTTNITQELANDYLNHLKQSDTSASHGNKIVKSLKRLFKWQEYQKGLNPWEPNVAFSSGNTSSQPRDYLTKEERTKIREAALEYGSVPGYNDLTPSERDQWKTYLAQRFGKPKSEVTPEDWEKANEWKIPSMVWVSLDAGLRPVEIERASVSWIDTQNGMLRIPKEDSSKNRDNWYVGLTERTADSLRRWLRERENCEMYHGTDSLWLTREGNPYQAQSLRYLLRRLCKLAEIPVENRKMSWYAIRHSLGTYMTAERDLKAAQSQLRHKSPQTTMRYDQTPIEDRKEALERIG